MFSPERASYERQFDRVFEYSGPAFAGKRNMRITPVFACLALAVGCRTNEVPEQQAKDVEITARLKTKLAEDLGAATVTNISVNATNGVVTLAGTVHNSGEESKAIAIARATPKVVRVNDNLQVVATP